MKSLSLIATVLVLSCAQAQLSSTEVKTVDSVDLHKYIGLWYEIASIPQSFQKKCIANTTAEYSFAENNLVKVINSCDTDKGTRAVAEGRARVEDEKSNSKLKVTFVKILGWVFSFGGNYWILDLAQDYSYSVVGDPTKNYAWILSRQATLPLQTLKNIERNLKIQGYDTCKILTSIQKGGYNLRQPLCEVVKLSQ